MKLSSLVLLSLAFLPLTGASLLAAVDDPPRQRSGGFTGATPRPGAKKKSTPAATTPAPKKKPKPADDAAVAEPSPDVPAKRTKPPGTAAKSSDGSVTSSKAKAPTEEHQPEKKTAPSEPTDAEVNVPPPPKPERAPAASLEPGELAEFSALPPRTQMLIAAALELTKLNLTYTYGSDDPARGGMDCSGTMAYVLRAQGFRDVPRDSSSQYVWARKGGPFFSVVSKSAESFEFKDLQPGDLLFWTGTYETGREIPISHVMLYLGTEKKTKKRVMFGASDGRSYAGIQRWGVSVFDFKMPNGAAANGERAKVDFVGYGRIPGLREAVASEPAAETPPATPAPVASAAATPKPRSAAKAPASATGTRKKKRSE